MLFDAPVSITNALRSSMLKRVLALAESVGSRDIQEFIPAQVRDAAFFSARTPFAEYLSDTATLITRMVQPDVRVQDGAAAVTGPGQSISPAQVRARMKQHLAALGYQPQRDQAGGLQDLSSDRRTNLIIDTQLGLQRGKGAWLASQDPDVLSLYPADELYRAIQPRIKGRDWQTRWNDARSTLGQATSATYAETPRGPFVARKNDPIWTQISAFGNPYPPYDYGSGMRVRDVGRRRAVSLGVLADGESVAPATDPVETTQSVSLAGMPPEIAAALQAAFGARAVVSGGRLMIAPQETP